MDNTAPSTKEKLLPEVTFGMAIMRGVLALGLGLLLFFIPDKSLSMLGNTMGFFWLVSGIALLRRSRDDSLFKMVGNRTTTAVAVTGVLAGILAITRNLAERVVPEAVVISLLGVVILLTGLLHATAQIRAGSAFSRGHRALNLLLGIFEIVLGLTLVLSPLDHSLATYWIAAIWALVFGIMVIGQAFIQRAQTGKAAEEESPTPQVPPAP